MPKTKTPNQKSNLQISKSPNGANKLSATDFLNQFLEEALESRQESINVDETNFVGTLPDWSIKQHIKNGAIKIDPLPENWEELVDEVTIDFHLGDQLREFTTDGLNTIDLKHTGREEMESMMRKITLKPGQPFILTENDFVIATTKEKLTLPDNIIGHLHGKSSLARLGIVVHSTAARFDP